MSMLEDEKLLTQKLDELSLIILKDGKTLLESKEEGMRPLLVALRRFGRTGLRGTVIADKVVGKAAALLISYIDPKTLYCGTLSQSAIDVLRRHRISYHAVDVVPEILNRSGDERCPFERAVADSEAPVKAYREITMLARSFMSESR
ncbi:MAG: DUF1893 domain-containing protein [Candidatus Bathyarchaeia archaeon]